MSSPRQPMTKHSTAPQRTRAPLTHLAPQALLALALSACGEAALAPLTGERVIGTLLGQPRQREVLSQNVKRPVQVRLITPRRLEGALEELLPALEMAPPAKVALEIPALGEGALLEFATGVDLREWAQEGRVRFRASLDGALLVDEQRELGQAAPVEARGWHQRRVDVSGGGRLVLETSYEGAATRPVLAGFASLRLLASYELERRRATPEQPSVVMIVIDTLRADRLHCYGHAEPVSPIIDALAARGTLFEQAYSATPWTPPSTATLLSGLSPPAHGLAGTSTQYLSEELTTLPERFRDEGFDTAAFSANPLIVQSRNFSQGFRSFHEYVWQDTDVFLEEVERWIEAQGAARYFLYLQLVEPHDPYRPSAQMRERFAGHPPPGWEEREQTDIIKEAKRLGPFDLESLLPHNRQNLALYDAEIASVDARLGRLFALLRRLGQDECTIVALTSDHGEEFLEHGLIVHAIQLHDECVHVPLILAGPGVPAGERVGGRVQNQRLGATLLRLAGLQARGFPCAPDLLATEGDGPVFVTTTRGNMFDEESARWERVGELHGVRSGPWYLDWSPPQAGREREYLRLCDLRADPEARVDVSAQHPEEVLRLKAAIAGWLAQEQGRQPQLLREGSAELELLRAAGYAGGEDE